MDIKKEIEIKPHKKRHTEREIRQIYKQAEEQGIDKEK
jgi:hypothetical protein